MSYCLSVFIRGYLKFCSVYLWCFVAKDSRWICDCVSEKIPCCLILPEDDISLTARVKGYSTKVSVQYWTRNKISPIINRKPFNAHYYGNSWVFLFDQSIKLISCCRVLIRFTMSQCYFNLVCSLLWVWFVLNSFLLSLSFHCFLIRFAHTRERMHTHTHTHTKYT